MSVELVVDLGSANTLVSGAGGRLLFDGPTVVARDAKRGRVLGIGAEALAMARRSPGAIEASRPVSHGTVCDYEAVARMLRIVFRRCGASRLHRPRVTLCVPAGATTVHRRAAEEAALDAGARAVHLVEQPVAGALGIGLSLDDTRGAMVVDVGGGTTQAAVICLGTPVATASTSTGGIDLDEAVRRHLRDRHELVVSLEQAEEVKLACGSHASTVVRVLGRDVRTGAARRVELAVDEVRAALRAELERMVATVVRCLGQAPPELLDDVSGRGIHLIGGSSRLKGLAECLANRTGLPVHLEGEPDRCVVRGAARLAGLVRGRVATALAAR